MNRISRETWVAIGLLVVLVIVTIFAGAQQTSAVGAPVMSKDSSDPDGALALWRWLPKLGYSVSDQILSEFEISITTDVIMVLEPLLFLRITDNEWEILDEWVSDGGTLFIVGEGFGTVQAAKHYKFDMRFLEETIPSSSPPAPFLLAPPLTIPASIDARSYFETERTEFLPLLTVEAGPVLVQIRKGAGSVILFANRYALSNVGLKKPGNPELMLNLLAHVEPNSEIWFDEWHHGNRLSETSVRGPGDWLRYTPAGRSILYMAIVTFIGLVLNGRNFGRPVPLSSERPRRSPLEYVTAIANLNRLAGHRMAVLGQYKQDLKRHLGARYRLDPKLDNDEFVNALVRYNPYLDSTGLLDLLTRLQNKAVGEMELVNLAIEATDWLEGEKSL